MALHLDPCPAFWQSTQQTASSGELVCGCPAWGWPRLRIGGVTRDPLQFAVQTGRIGASGSVPADQCQLYSAERLACAHETVKLCVRMTSQVCLGQRVCFERRDAAHGAAHALRSVHTCSVLGHVSGKDDQATGVISRAIIKLLDESPDSCEYLPGLALSVLPALQHPSPIVRRLCCNIIGRYLASPDASRSQEAAAALPAALRVRCHRCVMTWLHSTSVHTVDCCTERSLLRVRPCCVPHDLDTPQCHSSSRCRMQTLASHPRRRRRCAPLPSTQTSYAGC